MHCLKCGKNINKSQIEVGEQIYMRITGFSSHSCKQNVLGIQEAAKLDKALIISRAFSKGFVMERSLSFDGDNYTFRIPKVFTGHVKKGKVEITPICIDRFCATIEQQ